MPIQCPRCGFHNPDHAVVCSQCATTLVKLCPNCGFGNPGNFKFCGNCGANLDAPPTRAPGDETRPRVLSPLPETLAHKIASVGKQIEGERRTVTVLFSDLKGYTAIAEKLDPEDVYGIIDSTLKAFTEEIYKHEGTLDKVMGDGLMALFGAPVAHEDDPARAVRAALGMQAALRRINAELEARLGISLQVRIGLNTGTVVVGGIGSDLRMEYTALGDTVNVASRLQTVAEPGTILVSRSVYEFTKPLFEFRELGSIRVKNRTEPVEIFETIAPKQIAGRVRGVPGLSAPMVGRQAEFARVRHVVDDLITHRAGRVVLVTGNAGIGKSRLTSELKTHLAGKWVNAHEGACVSYGQPAYGIFLQILKSVFKIGENESEEMMREKIERTIQALLPTQTATPTILPYIEHLFSIRVFEKDMAARIRHLAPAQLQEQTFIAIRDLLVTFAQIKPLILIFEDIHWIDALSLELLLFLLTAVESAPLLIYCNSRPAEGVAVELLTKRASEFDPAHFVHLPLQPLSHADSVALIDLLLTIHELPETLHQVIPQRAEGNPFYLEEIVRMLIDRGIIQRVNEHWAMTPDADLEHLQVPTTLEGLILARVDHLGEGARQAVQCAAVIGRNFSLRLLSSVIESARNLDDDLQELEERQLVSRLASDDELEYRFNHVLLQDTIYNSLLLRRREYLHHKIGVSVENLFREHLEDHLEELAFHYAESKDTDRALPYLIRAGKRAEDRFANEQALKHYRLAADFLARANANLEQKIKVYAGLGAVQTFTGDYPNATTSYLIALEHIRAGSKSIQSARDGAETMRALGRVCERRGDYTEALRWLENALAELEPDPDPQSAERVRIFNDLGWVQYRRGEFEQAYEWGMRALRVVEGTEYFNEMASAYNRLVAIFIRNGDWERANAYAEKGLRLREMIGDLRGVANSHTNIGVIAWEQGNWVKALDALERSLEIKQRIGDSEGISRLNNNLCELYREKGDYARAAALGARALQNAEKIKDRNSICLALNNQAHLAILQAQFARAVEDLQRSRTTATQIGSKEKLAEAEWLRAEAYLGLAQLDDARTAAEQAFKIASEIKRKLLEGKTLCTLGKIARRQNEFGVANDFLRRSIETLAKLKSPFELAKSQVELAQLLHAQDQAAEARALLEQALGTFTRLGAEAECRRAHSALEQLTPAPVSNATG